MATVAGLGTSDSMDAACVDSQSGGVVGAGLDFNVGNGGGGGAGGGGVFGPESSTLGTGKATGWCDGDIGIESS